VISKSTPLILVSNDDGIHAPGIQALARALRRIGDVVVVAPEGQQSASSHSITLHRPLRTFRYDKQSYSVDGTPTDCITVALHSILKKKPDLIVSGINSGANLCDDVHYSGTVSAAMEGAIQGVRSIAVSLVRYDHLKSKRDVEENSHYETAARFAVKLSKKVLKEQMPPGFVLNVNVPNVPASKIAGAVVTTLGKRNYGSVLVEKTDPRGRKYFWFTGDEHGFMKIPGTDGVEIQKNKITVTPLQVDLNHYTLLEDMRHWKL
jgi:5'-nucleotidase